MNVVFARGAIVYTIINKMVYYIIVKNKKDVYGFPKGLAENEESELETALREIHEETSLNVEIDTSFRKVLEYIQPEYNRIKYVTYFLGKYENQEFKLQEEELKGIFLLSFDEAKQLIKEKNTLELFEYANEEIIKKENI